MKTFIFTLLALRIFFTASPPQQHVYYYNDDTTDEDAWDDVDSDAYDDDGYDADSTDDSHSGLDPDLWGDDYAVSSPWASSGFADHSHGDQDANL